MSPRLYVIGVPGAGKSSVARALARMSRLAVTETDDLVAEACGLPAGEALLTLGEAAFRDLEAQALRRAADTGGIAVLGGGVLDRDEALAAVEAEKQTGHAHVLLLDCGLPVLVSRLGLDRPRSVGLGPVRAQVRAMRDARLARWSSLDPIRVDTGAKSAEESAREAAHALAAAGFPLHRPGR